MKRAFTLIELLLAIFLVGLFAYFVFATPQPVTKAKVEVNATTLPRYLQDNLVGDGELICVDNCKSCYYLRGSNKAIEAALPITLHINGEYILDSNDNPQRVELGRFKDKKICLRLRHYKNNSISKVILDLGDEFLYIPSYFGEGKIFSSLNDARDWWIKDTQNLRSQGEFY